MGVFLYPYPKDPEEVLDYEIDWRAVLGTDTIVSQSTTVTGASLVASAIDATNKKVIFRISGGAVGVTATIENTINTASGQIAQRTARLRISQR